MSKPQLSAAPYVQPYRYASPNIPMSAIKRFARRIADKFHPDKIILFGSYAYGTPHNESDVDLLVIMPCRNAIDQSVRITLAFERPFSFDLIVRTPYQMRQGLKDPNDRDWFLYEITQKGKVLYEAPHSSVGSQSRGRYRGRTKPGETVKATARRSRVSLPTVSRKVLQGDATGTRRSRAKNP